MADMKLKTEDLTQNITRFYDFQDLYNPEKDLKICEHGEIEEDCWFCKEDTPHSPIDRAEAILHHLS